MARLCLLSLVSIVRAPNGLTTMPRACRGILHIMAANVSHHLSSTSYLLSFVPFPPGLWRLPPSFSPSPEQRFISSDQPPEAWNMASRSADPMTAAITLHSQACNVAMVRGMPPRLYEQGPQAPEPWPCAACRGCARSGLLRWRARPSSPFPSSCGRRGDAATRGEQI